MSSIDAKPVSSRVLSKADILNTRMNDKDKAMAIEIFRKVAALVDAEPPTTRTARNILRAAQERLARMALVIRRYGMSSHRVSYGEEEQGPMARDLMETVCLPNDGEAGPVRPVFYPPILTGCDDEILWLMRKLGADVDKWLRHKYAAALDSEEKDDFKEKTRVPKGESAANPEKNIESSTSNSR